MKPIRLIAILASAAFLAAQPISSGAQPAIETSPPTLAPVQPNDIEPSPAPAVPEMVEPHDESGEIVGPMQITPFPTDPSNDPDYPSTLFAVKGDVLGDSVWDNMRLFIGSGILRTSLFLPNQRVTDLMTIRVRVTMTSMRPLISWTCVYSPSSTYPYLDMDTHLQIYFIVNGVEMFYNNTNPFSCNSSGSHLVENNFNYMGSNIEIGVRAWTMNLDDDYQTVGARTGVAYCDPAEMEDPPIPNQGILCRFI